MAQSSRKLILDDALDGVGFTPLARLDRLAKEHGLKCNLYGKVEFLSIGGSVKDRIAKRMVEEAEKDGRLIPGKSIVIEPTSGNTGIGLALACAIKGYPLIITLPQKMSLEKEATLRALGAEIVRTPTEAASDSPESNLGVAKRLEQELPHGIILNQYVNPNNPLAHEHGTGPEIIQAIESTVNDPSGRPTSGKVDVLVSATGTGGTITGLSHCMKTTHNKDCVILGVDPVGSILSGPSKDPIGGYTVEGIGYDFVPDVLNQGYVDDWVKTTDDEAYTIARQLIRMEALLVGGSSGSATAGALRYLKEGGAGWEKFGSVEGKNVVVILADGIRNYISKPWFVDGFKPEEPTPLSKAIVEAMERTAPKKKPMVNGVAKINGIIYDLLHFCRLL